MDGKCHFGDPVSSSLVVRGGVDIERTYVAKSFGQHILPSVSCADHVTS